MQAAFKRRPGEANIAICIGCIVFTALSWWDSSREGMAIFRCTADNVYGGKPWALITSVFLHGGPMHILMNLSFLWSVGNALEEKVGSVRYVGFVILSAAVSNALELSFHGPPIGISGVICAIFGFMWQSRHHYQDFYIEASDRSVKFLFTILVVMIPIDYFIDSLAIAHVAHFAGLGFGMATARAFVPGYKPKDRAAGWASVAILTALTILSIVYAPWSKTWLIDKSLRAVRRDDYGKADYWLTRTKWIDDKDPYVLMVHAAVKIELGDIPAATAILERLQKISPEYAQRLQRLNREAGGPELTPTDDDDEETRTPGPGK